MPHVELFYSGYCMANSWFVEKGKPFKNVPFVALWALIKSEEEGYILFDTGYADHHLTCTAFYPNKMFAHITKVFIDPVSNAKEQLRLKGIDAEEIKHVVISHFHADHVGGLKDFTKATFWCKKEAYEHIRDSSDFWAFSKGYLKDLLPENMADRLKFLDEGDPVFIDGLKKCWSFIDPAIVIVDLPGHARGHVGLLFSHEQKFLVADAAWTTDSIIYKRYPRRIVAFLVDSYTRLIQTSDMLCEFQAKNPSIELIVTHCPSIVTRCFKGIIKA